MTLTLPEALMLFALRDDRGTVHSAAFLALDPALRGAVLAEFKLRGHIHIKRDGSLKRTPEPPPLHPLLLDSFQLFADAPAQSTVTHWLSLLSNRMVDLRVRVVNVLERRGILVNTGDKERETAWMGDAETEEMSRQHLLSALDLGEAIAPRDGILIALTLSCHLGEVVFGPRAAEAAQLSEWVATREVIVRAVNANIAEIEGSW